MPFVVPIDTAKVQYPEYTFIAALTPSEQKAAFHVRDAQGCDLCLKIIAPNYPMDRLSREVLALQSLAHPNVARLREYEFSTRAGVLRHYLVEEFIVGDDLSARLQLGRSWPRPDVSRFFSALCDGLTALKAANLVHRDLKPGNIRVRPDGTPVIIDFGVARHLDRSDLTNTGQGAAIGTPLYFAPEQFQGTKHDIDHRTDLFAVGIMMYQALIGTHPFWVTGITPSQLNAAICTSTDYQSAPTFIALPAEWRLIQSRLLEKERARRPQNAAQVSTILRKIGGV